ncbi:Dihydrofolate reductase [Sinorhizobium sojae CCBAU 05684]|uniref:Dihydrofolate reductase n=1 Tax=Sinorhizobium sojae CCBAU 05684 TaxID=716928 RepID=A0A249PBQ7_9HYPH|nr:dihydrofolate reductase family protein [Sinorhizobium sojae]ASY63266.1 Dihydrofolate reductase [Sinorhizobium sojae CCBAU 05684]
MPKVIVSGLSVSIDGFAAGPQQSLHDPLGIRGLELHEWFFENKQNPAMTGATAISAQVDERVAQRAMDGFGSFVLGRNMFGPNRGEWGDDSWKGWWGDDPPWRAPTFILTHFPRPPIEMEGGTTFYFVTTGIFEALERAKKAAGAKNVKIGGGVSTVRQYVKAGLVDELQLSISPTFLGQGESLFPGLDFPALGFSIVERAIGAHAMHITLSKNC